MKFSLIIPCYNSHKTIKRLFDSLVRQGLAKKDLQIIVVDDNSTDKSYLDIIKDYEYRFDIEYYSTNTDVHCPGNTRQEGLNHATGDWICFADHDDLFEDNAFRRVRNYIEKTKDHTIYVVSTIINMYDTDTRKYIGNPYKHFQVLLHGKWYNKKELIDKYNIHFKKDLISHEDGFFNNLCLSYLIRDDKDWDYLDINTYKWCNNPESLSRKQNQDRGYLCEHFNDYLAISNPFIPHCNDEDDSVAMFFINQVIMTILHAYFYYEALIYRNSYTNYKDMLLYIKNFIHYVYKNTNIDSKYMIDYIYYDPEKYYHVYDDCTRSTGMFICRTSFRDFILKLS